jgi:hypothetical protein
MCFVLACTIGLLTSYLLMIELWLWQNKLVGLDEGGFT